MTSETREPLPQRRPAPRGRPSGDHGAKRARLLEATTRVIAREGVGGASLRKVAHEAACTTGAVTYYFPTKDALLRALAESQFDRFDSLLDVSSDVLDIRDVIDRWLDMSTADPADWAVMSAMLSHARDEPVLAEMIADRYAGYRDHYTAFLAEAQAAGIVRDDIPAELLADQLAAIGDGWTMMFHLEPERFSGPRREALLDAYVALVEPRDPDQRRGVA